MLVWVLLKHVSVKMILEACLRTSDFQVVYQKKRKEKKENDVTESM